MIRRTVIAIVLAAGAFAGTRTVRADELKLHANRLYVPVTINGLKVEALLDSAAEGTFVDQKLAAQLKLKPEGSQTAKGSGGSTEVLFAKNVNIEAAGVRLANMTVALLDMTELSSLVQTDLQIILGREFFDAARVEVDIEGGTIRKLDRSVEPAGVKFSLTSHRGIEHVPCKVEGNVTKCDIDLGNGSEPLVGKGFAEKHGLDQPGRIIERKQGGGIGGSIERDIILMSSLEVGGVKFENVRGAIDPQPTAGEMNIGTSVLRRFVLVIDYAQRTVWFNRRN